MSVIFLSGSAPTEGVDDLGGRKTVLRDEVIAKEIDALVQAALRLVAERPGRLVGLTIRIPPDILPERFCREMDARLAVVGLDFVDLSIDAGRGPMRIVAADFHAE